MFEVTICISLHGFILDYIQNIRDSDILFPNSKLDIELLPHEARKLYRVLHHIFPKLKTISFQLGEIYIQILMENLVYKVIDNADPTIKYYSLDDSCKHINIGKSTLRPFPFEA
jgi:hypothetical protein